MVQIAISQEFFDAIVATMQLGNVGFENKTDELGNRLIWIPHHVLARLNALRGRGDSYSDVILRIAEQTATLSVT